MAAAVVLSGCAAAMLGGAARSGSQPATGASGASTPAGASNSRSPAAPDSSISTAVRSRFSANAALKPLKIAVDTHDGVVTLTGQVNNVEQRNAAQLEARAVTGVKGVKNELTVRQ
jgi:hyperosmotically inducible protein